MAMEQVQLCTRKNTAFRDFLKMKLVMEEDEKHNQPSCSQLCSLLCETCERSCRRLAVSIFSLTLVYWKRREPQSRSTLANGIKYHLQKQCICQFLTTHDENSSGLKYLLIQIFPCANFFGGGILLSQFLLHLK